MTSATSVIIKGQPRKTIYLCYIKDIINYNSII